MKVLEHWITDDGVAGVRVELTAPTGAVVEASFILSEAGLTVRRIGYSSNCISFHDLLATSEHQLGFLFNALR